MFAQFRFQKGLKEHEFSLSSKNSKAGVLSLFLWWGARTNRNVVVEEDGCSRNQLNWCLAAQPVGSLHGSRIALVPTPRFMQKVCVFPTDSSRMSRNVLKFISKILNIYSPSRINLTHRPELNYSKIPNKNIKQYFKYFYWGFYNNLIQDGELN